MSRYLVFGLIIITGGALMNACARTTPISKDSERPIFLGYYPARLAERQLPPEAIRYERFTHLCHAFVTNKPNGELITNKNIPSRDLTRLAHKAGTRVFISVGGGGGSDKFMPPMAADPVAFERYVSALVGLVDEYDYDGIDLDWEYPNNEETKGDFSKLARRLRKDLDALGEKRDRSYGMTIAVSASDWAGKWLDADTLRETMDFVNIMTYDFAGPWGDVAGHNSPLRPSRDAPSEACVEAGIEYWHTQRGLPKEMCIVGLPSYGHGFPVGQPYADTPRKHNEHTWISYTKVQRLLAEEGWHRKWDEAASVPWAFSPDGKRLIGYDDTESVTAKTKWAMDEDYGGVFFWCLGSDLMPDGSEPLFEAARKALDEAR
jgi:chitinase